MKRKHKKKSAEQQSIAKQRIKQLFEQADEIYPNKLANRYVELARKIAMKCKVKIPSMLKRKFCKHCYCYLRPGDNARVRLSNGKLIYSCFQCKKFTRLPYRGLKTPKT